jgi:hypothetical protein
MKKFDTNFTYVQKAYSKHVFVNKDVRPALGFENKNTESFSQSCLKLSLLQQKIHEYGKNLARNHRILDLNHFISIIS